MKANIERKNVRECLDFWAQAEKQQKTLSFNDHDEMHVVYDSVTEHAPELQRELTHLAVLRMVGKIQTELREFAANMSGKSAEELMLKLPSLGQFTASGKLGNLREEWQKLQSEGVNKRLALATERQNIFNEFRGLLPKMPTHFENDGTAILRNDFTSIDHQKKIEKEIEALANYKLNANGYYQTFENDLSRTRWIIEINGKTESFEIGTKDKTLEAIKKAFGNDLSALATASKIMNQAAPIIVSGANDDFFPRNNRIFIERDKNYGELTFLRISSNGEHIKFKASTYSKSVNVLFNADDNNKGGRNWPVNEGERWKGTPGPNNYTQLYQLSMQIDKNAARNGILKPADGTQIEALYEIRLCPEVRRKI